MCCWGPCWCLYCCWLVSIYFWHPYCYGSPFCCWCCDVPIVSATVSLPQCCSQLHLQASLLLVASILCWRSCCCFNSCCCLLFCCCEQSSDNRTMAIGLSFFSAFELSEYRIGQLKKVSDYQISDQASIYRTTGYQTQKKLAVAHLCRLDCVSQLVEERPRP
jgi:hypothetical protein